jgi:1-acyl-sn-glycerol-3-phosphate acyltransferase
MPLIDHPLGAKVPRRGNALTQALGLLLLRLTGWRITGRFPDVPKAVVILAPHTSNRDGFIVAMVILALRLRVGLMAKDSLFRPPIGGFFRWLGGIPVHRDSSRNLVEQTVDAYAEREQLWLGMSPEGTRTGADAWRSGFYHIARQAQIPIAVVALDYGRKELRVADTIHTSADQEADMQRILACFRGVQGRHRGRLSKPLADLDQQT